MDSRLHFHLAMTLDEFQMDGRDRPFMSEVLFMSHNDEGMGYKW